MTNEDEKIVADYMVWKYWPSGKGQCYRVSENGGDVIIHFDLNDVGLVVEEMQKRGDWITFVSFVDDYHYNADIQVEFTAWLFNAENFFLAFCEWRKGK